MHEKTSTAPNIKKFIPPKRILLGPGPSDVPKRILDAMARPTLGHLDPEFIRMMDEVKLMLQYAFKTKNELTMAVSAPGSAGMETCFVNLVEPGDKVIVCINGVFGGRMKENVERSGGKAVVVEDEWGKPVDPNKVEDTLKKNPDAKILAFVHAETSTGARSDAEALVKLAHNHNTLVIVDAVTSLGGIPLLVDDWNIDAVYSGSQKCLSCTPGLSPISFSQAAVDVIKKRKTKVQSWFLDLNLVMSYWGGGAKRAYHHTAPINALYGLHESLVMLLEEGIENRWQRHKENHFILKDELQKLNLEFFVEEKFRLPQLNSVKIPASVDDANVRGRLLKEFNIEIGAGLGPMSGKIWRIGLLGYSSRRENIDKLTQALKKIL
jgi:alanine-glyoxylate transaminase / serine-glyoxylate transaminase / serine-pyruvate transaminase